MVLTKWNGQYLVYRANKESGDKYVQRWCCNRTPKMWGHGFDAYWI